MNLAVSPIAAHTLKMTLSLQTLDSGRILATVLEISDCHVEAETREEAIAAVNASLQERFSQVELLAIEVSILPSDATSAPVNPTNQPWMEFAGIFKDDPYFERVLQTIQSERDANGDEEIDASEYAVDDRVAS
jgi:hypothetical protein